MTRHSPIVVIGLGEMGSVFARGFLSRGHPVFPVLRDGDPPDVLASSLPEPELVLVAVGEADLEPVLRSLPDVWRSRLMLIQNELLPRDWEGRVLAEPTVAPVWFEKKPGRPVTVLVSTPVTGPAASLVVASLHGIAIDAHEISGDAMLEALVVKNLYILTANIAGLRTRGTVDDLWKRHRDLAEAVAGEVLALQEWLTGRSFERSRIVAGMVAAFEGDPEHGTMGRSAPHRLERALGHAAEAGIAVPTLESIGREQGVSA